MYRAVVRGTLASAALLAVVLLVARSVVHQPTAMALLGVVGGTLILASLAWGLLDARDVPSDARVARFIEEQESALDERLVSAVDVLAQGAKTLPSALAEPLVAEAARAAAQLDPSAILPSSLLQKAGLQAAGAVLLLAVTGVAGRNTMRESADSISLALFPSRVVLEVMPGDGRVRAGAPFTVKARLVGNRAPVIARLLRADGSSDEFRPNEMKADGAGAFELAFDTVGTPFRYKVVAGNLSSKTYSVDVTRPPRVMRVEVEYHYPAALALPPRVEQDGGDVYAPPGTDVQLRIHADRGSLSGQLAFGDGKTLGLQGDGTSVLNASLKVAKDDTYRIALADTDGLKNPGETEFYIRTVEDRPPEVRVLRPARDRSVSALEEVDVEVQAEDDFGVDRVELVYGIRGGVEKVVPLRIESSATLVNSKHTVYLEDLKVKPGDFVSYYVRARDIARGKRSSEARSDMFFFEVKPFEEEFTLAQSDAQQGGSGNRSLDDLAAAERQIIIATWKLDRRSRAAGVVSEVDVRQIANVQSELRARAEQVASSFRENTMRDPRRAASGRSQTDELGPDEVSPEEGAMAAAALAMGAAVNALNHLVVTDAVPIELEALNQLMKAQSEVKKRQIARQRVADNEGNNRASQDLSTLFDKELQRQQTNYETPTSAEQTDDQKASMVDKIKDLAQRQDELLKAEEKVERESAGMNAPQRKRELEKLIAEQTKLRQRAEEIAQQMAQQRAGAKTGQNGSGGQGAQGSQTAQGQESGQAQAQAQAENRVALGIGQQQMRDISEEMRNAATALRNDDPAQAGQRSSQAIAKLRDLEQRFRVSGPDEERRQMGEVRLEARQIADAQRDVATDLERTGGGDGAGRGAAADALRRIAGEEERLASRVRRVQDELRRQAIGSGGAGSQASSGGASAAVRQAVSDALRDADRQQLADRMQQSADEIRATAAQVDRKDAKELARLLRAAATTDREMAKALDKLAERLAGSDDTRDVEARRLTEQRTKARELREKLGDVSATLQQLDQQARAANESGDAATPDRSGQPGQQGKAGSNPANGGEFTKLRQEYERQMQQTQALLEEARRDDPTVGKSGPGSTFAGQGMILSAPGTEAFKQDFAKWEQLRKTATTVLEGIESSAAQKLQAKQSRDRLASGVDDRAPAEYERQVDAYFRALASKRTP